MSRYAYALAVALLLAGCATPAGKPLARLNPNDARIAEAIKEATGAYASWEGPVAIEAVERQVGDLSIMDDIERSDWVEFRANYHAGDEIYFMTTSAEKWKLGLGYEGYVLVRGPRGIGFYCTLKN